MQNQSMVLYGCGELGRLAKSFFDFFNIDVIPVDINPSFYKDDNFWAGTKIYKIEEINKDTNPLIVVCISTYSYGKIKTNLYNKGYTNVVSFFEKAEQINKESGYKHPLRNGWILKEDPSTIRALADKLFLDDLSKKHYYQFDAWHSDYVEIGPEIDCKNRYFIPEVVNVLTDHEIFVDGGAYDGRVSLKFKEIVNDKYDSIRCIEPDVENFKLLSNNITGRVLLGNVALGDRNGEVGFSSGFNYMSKVNDAIPTNTVMVKLDSLGLQPTILKLHLEGGELEAIKGGIGTIKKFRPILMVTTYHTEEGLCDIPLYLFENLDNYKFLWRNHNYMGQGAVIYCIPKER